MRLISRSLKNGLEISMSHTLTSGPLVTLADLLRRLGGVPPDRVRFHPLPGLATEADVLELAERDGILCELIDGVLVEKPMGYRESYLAMALVQWLRDFVVAHNLGIVTGPGGMMRLFPGLLRIPDVAFVSWDRCPNRSVPQEPIPELAPNLAIEVLSASNTEGEMQVKCGEYFAAGTQLVWLVDLKCRKVSVCTAPDISDVRGEEESLDGGEVLPGFELSIRDLFAELDRHG
jgi:Uma2 family endonuclease